MGYRCPACSKELTVVRGEPGVTFACPAGHGVAATVEVLRRRVETATVNRLWQGALAVGGEAGGACPGCGREARRIDGASVCRGCQLVWFEGEGLAELPPPAVEPERAPLPPAALEALAEGQVGMIDGTDPHRHDVHHRVALVIAAAALAFVALGRGDAAGGRLFGTGLFLAVLIWAPHRLGAALGFGGRFALAVTKPSPAGALRAGAWLFLAALFVVALVL